jgi:hypothetical protein
MSDKAITPVYHKLFMEPAIPDEAWEPVNPAEVIEIRVFRLEGTKPVILGGYAPDFLPDCDAVKALFGGGNFDVRAINASGRVFRRCVFTLPGEPRLPPSSSGASPAPTTAVAVGAPDGDPMWLRAAMVLGPLVPAYLAHVASERARSDEQFRLMISTVLESGKATSQQSADLVKSLLERATAPVAAAGPQSTIEQLRELRAFDKEVAKDTGVDQLIKGGMAAALPILPLLLAKLAGAGGFGGNSAPAIC